jgi:hypothetical protein
MNLPQPSDAKNQEFSLVTELHSKRPIIILAAQPGTHPALYMQCRQPSPLQAFPALVFLRIIKPEMKMVGYPRTTKVPVTFRAFK